MCRIRLLLIIMLLALLTGCSRGIRLAADPQTDLDLTGSWELNYQLSERVQENMEALMLMARSHSRRSRGPLDEGWLQLPSLGLIKLAESVSRATVLEIEQTDHHIEIAREDDFPLLCELGEGSARVSEDPLGSEICGWDAHQLVFAFALPDGLRINHRLTLAPDGDKLNIATTVTTRGSGQSFTLNRVYTRFEPLAEPFDCRLTPSGEKSCRRRTPEESASSL